MWGLILDIPMNMARDYLEFSGVEGDVLTLLGYVTYAFGVVPLACAYTALIALWVSKGSKFLEWFSPVGRAALSNYIFQTFISICIFYGIGLGLGTTIGLSLILLICVSVFVFQVIMSKRWLSHFHYGPLEWLWRQLTYGKKMPIRKK